MNKVTQSSQGCPHFRRLVERYESLILVPRGLPVWNRRLTRPLSGRQCRGPLFLGPHQSRPPKGDLCLLPSLEDWLLGLLWWPILTQRAWPGCMKNCPSRVILGAGGWRLDGREACLGCEWLREASPGYHVSLSTVSRNLLVYVPQVASVIQGRRCSYLLAQWQLPWKQ